jgi:hypothetical protein
MFLSMMIQHPAAPNRSAAGSRARVRVSLTPVTFPVLVGAGGEPHETDKEIR